MQPKIVCAACGDVLDVEFDDNNGEYRVKICRKCLGKNDADEYMRGHENGGLDRFDDGYDEGKDSGYEEGHAQGYADCKRDHAKENDIET